MPVFDVQLLHTHPDRLPRVRKVVEDQLARATPEAIARARWIGRILADRRFREGQRIGLGMRRDLPPGPPNTANRDEDPRIRARRSPLSTRAEIRDTAAS